MPRVQLPAVSPRHKAWNKGRIIGQKRPLLPKQVWAIRARLELAGYLRDLALFNVAIDSKLRGCDLVKLAVADLVKDGRVRERVSIIQSKTKKPVQFELTENTRDTVIAWVRSPEMIGCRFMFPSRFHDRPHISTRQYGRLVRDWVTAIGLEPSRYGTHSMRRTKAAEIYRKTGNLRAVQLLLGTRRSIALCDTWALNWKMPLVFLNASISERSWRTVVAVRQSRPCHLTSCINRPDRAQLTDAAQHTSGCSWCP